jgi:hypothetical protein
MILWPVFRSVSLVPREWHAGGFHLVYLTYMQKGFTCCTWSACVRISPVHQTLHAWGSHLSSWPAFIRVSPVHLTCMHEGLTCPVDLYLGECHLFPTDYAPSLPRGGEQLWGASARLIWSLHRGRIAPTTPPSPFPRLSLSAPPPP